MKRNIDFSLIKLIVSDCDGVLTDGHINYDNNEIETKHFSALDGLGLSLLHQSSIEFAVITGRESRLLSRRCKDLRITRLYQNINNKLAQTTQLLHEMDLNWSNVAYIGDDWNDYPVAKLCAFFVAPVNSMPDFQLKADYVTVRRGGDGAVREMIELILKEQGIYEETLDKLLLSLSN